MRIGLIALALATLLFAGIAAAQTTTTETTADATTTLPTTEPVPFDRFAASTRKSRRHGHNVKAQKCRAHAGFHFRRDRVDVPPQARRRNMDRWNRREAYAVSRSSACSPVDLGRKIAARRYGWTAGNGQWQALYALWSRESGWNPCRHYPSTTNCGYSGPSACGIPQFVPCSKLLDGCGATLGACPAAEQIRRGLDYIRSRWGTPGAALAHSNAYGWY
jgi:hypothetical protein